MVAVAHWFSSALASMPARANSRISCGSWRASVRGFRGAGPRSWWATCSCGMTQTTLAMRWATAQAAPLSSIRGS